MSKSRGSALPLSMRLAFRELRGGLGGFRIFVACLFLGVAIIAGVGSLTEALTRGMELQGRSLLGGDMEIRYRNAQASNEVVNWLQERGTVARAMRLRVMAYAESSGERTLVELKGVDSLYPMYGELRLSPELPVEGLFDKKGERFGIAIESALADRLEVEVGDTLQIGSAAFRIRALIVAEPDKTSGGMLLGPTALVSLDAVAASELEQPGSLIDYLYRVAFPGSEDPHLVSIELNDEFVGQSWQVRDRTTAAPGVRRFVTRMGMFLSLVGLTALVVGGVGVGNAVRAYLDSKTDTIATLKVLGATGATVFKLYLTQILMLGVGAIAGGLAAGAFLPDLVARLLAGKIPVPPESGVYPEALLIAGVFGVLVTLAFALWPLGMARDVPAARLFRTVVSTRSSRPAMPYLIAIAVLIGTVVALAIGLSDLKRLALGFTAAAAGSLVLLRLTGWLVMRAAQRAPRVRRPALRLAIANLHRPGAPTPAVVLSLGLGLTLFAAIALIEGNMSAQVKDQLPEEAPAFFFLDIQKDQIGDFRETVTSVDPGARLNTVPSLRGHVVKVKDELAADLKKERRGSWILNGDRGLTFESHLPDGNEIIAGEWWDPNYQGPPLISLDDGVAEDLDLQVGDTMVVSVLGREIEVEIANLRRIDWGTLGFNFGIVFDPATLTNAPFGYMATLSLDADQEAIAYRRLTDQFPNVTAVRMKEVLTMVNKLLTDIGMAVRATAAITVLTGILVLAGAIAAGHRHRVYDAVVLKVLGAVKSDVLRAYLLEYVLLGAITGAIAMALGALAGRVVIVNVMEFEFAMMPGIMAATVVAGVFVTTAIGLFGTMRALNAKPAQVLREF